MSKAVSPVRLQEDLMQAAKATGAAFHRSSAEQIEYWADLGRKVSDVLDPSVLLAVKAGFCRITVEETTPVTVDADDVFATLERKRADGSLSAEIANGHVRYQASRHHPGMLERVSPDGTVETGTFVNGVFESATVG